MTNYARMYRWVARPLSVVRQGSDQVFMWLGEGPSCGFG